MSPILNLFEAHDPGIGVFEALAEIYTLHTECEPANARSKHSDEKQNDHVQ
jgi:hypothetical protein